MKKKILFVYYDMTIGGSTTSLLSLLSELDFSKYDVDLLLYKNEGELLPYIPTQVNLLPQAYVNQPKIIKIIKSIADGTLIKACLHGIKYNKKLNPPVQSMSYCQAGYCRNIKTEYDVAIGYMELWSDVFTNLKIKAKKKISWIHTDYKKAKLYPDIDRNAFSNSEYIVSVSNECCDSFKEVFPELAYRVRLVPNILSEAILNKRAEGEVLTVNADKHLLKFLTVCRLDNLSKAIDRGINVVKSLVDAGYEMKWYIIGDGPDTQSIEKQIDDLSLHDFVILLGSKSNPYPYFKYFDAFLLISKFEGKPMAVTEAQILGLPVFVTNYKSAKAQVESGVEGLVCENDSEAIYKMLQFIITNPDRLNMFRKNVKSKKYGNEEDVRLLYEIID